MTNEPADKSPLELLQNAQRECAAEFQSFAERINAEQSAYDAVFIAYREIREHLKDSPYAALDWWKAIAWVRSNTRKIAIDLMADRDPNASTIDARRLDVLKAIIGSDSDARAEADAAAIRTLDPETQERFQTFLQRMFASIGRTLAAETFQAALAKFDETHLQAVLLADAAGERGLINRDSDFVVRLLDYLQSRELKPPHRPADAQDKTLPVPHYDKDSRALSYRGRSIKTFAAQAKPIHAVLAACERARWENSAIVQKLKSKSVTNALSEIKVLFKTSRIPYSFKNEGDDGTGSVSIRIKRRQTQTRNRELRPKK